VAGVVMKDSHTQQAIEDLAELLLTGPDGEWSGPQVEADTGNYKFRRPDDTPRPSPALEIEPAPTAPVVEAVLLGHLPGYASAWISQYAQHLADREGSSALIRTDGGALTVDLFDSEGEPGPQPLGGGRSLAPDLNGLLGCLDDLADGVGAILLVIDHLDRPAQRRRAWDLARWTILSGADDAAVVGAYHLLKTLLDAPEAEMPPQGVRLMFFGCEEDRARDAVARVNRAASAFLETDVQMAGVRKRVQPIHRRSLGEFRLPAHTDHWPYLRDLLRQIGQEGHAPESPDEFEDSEHAPLISAEELAALTGHADGSPPPLATPAPPPPRVDVVKPVWPQTPPVRRRKTEARTSDPAEAASSAATKNVAAPPRPPAEAEAIETDCAADTEATAIELHTYLPQATVLKATSPRHPGVQLSVDGEGQLHLAMRSADVGVSQSLRDLLQAGNWAQEHRQLIGLTCSDRSLDAEQALHLHLFTDQPRPAVELSAAGLPEGRRLHLHLLKMMDVSGRQVVLHEQLS